MAFAFKTASAKLGFVEYVVTNVEPIMAGEILAAVVFIIAGFLAFVTGNFWGLAAIMIPIAVSLSTAMEVNVFLTSAAVFCGAAFASQACLFGDAAVLVGKATDIRPYDFAVAQLPYACVAIILSTLLFVVFGYIA